MTRTDRKIIFTGMAFLAVVMKGKDASESESGQVKALAELIEAYCTDMMSGGAAFVSCESEPLTSDQIIGQHIRELRDNEETHLPEDKQALIELLDRLQYRKARRLSREFYGSATEARLADFVLKLLDEEIAYAEADKGVN